MERTIGKLIAHLARKSQLYIGKALEKYNITAAEQPFFMALQYYEGITQEELTSIVEVDKAATARAVKTLEEKGFLIRLQDKNDRRQKRIYPTELTRRLGDSVRAELFKFNDFLTEGIDEESLDIAYNALLKMERNFELDRENKNKSREEK